ncbi:MAG: glycosyltransferase family 39 protein [Vicinamibacteria bacterium]|nr:glycosyltransferase family 39 protein [Vicinamibacteria bacterium]
MSDPYELTNPDDDRDDIENHLVDRPDACESSAPSEVPKIASGDAHDAMPAWPPPLRPRLDFLIIRRLLRGFPARILILARSFASDNAPLLAILGIAAVLRFWGLAFGYPGKYRPDEEYLVSRALTFHSGDLNPHFFIYPTLYMYVLAAVFGFVRLSGEWLGAFGSGGFMDFLGRHHFAPLYVIARATTATSGVIGVWAVFRLGRVAYGKTVGLLAAGVLAVNFSHVRESHFATTDIPMTLLLTFAFTEIVGLVNDGRLRRYFLSGLLIGLAASTKYPAAAALVPLVVAAALRALEEVARLRSGAGITDRRLAKVFHVAAQHAGALIVAGVCFFMAFIMGSPYLLIDIATVRQNLAYQLPFAQEGVAGLEMPLGFAWLFQFGLPHAAGVALMTLLIIAILLAPLRALRYGPRRDAPALVLASFVIALCIPLIWTRWIFLRYVAPLMPVAAILAAALVVALASRVIRAKRVPLVAGLALGLASLGPAYRSALTSRLLAKTDTRQIARDWIKRHVPGGSDIAIHRAFVYGKPELPHGYQYVDIESGRGLLARWALLDDSPIRYYSPPPPESAVEMLNARGRLRERYDPFIPGLAKRAVFDPADAFYLPVSGLSSMRRPGPTIKIYEIAETPPKPPRSDCGLLGRYYPNTRWEGDPELVRVDTFFLFSWQDVFPVSTPFFSAEWIGRIETSSAGDHAFRLESDDGSTLTINDRLVVNNGGKHHPISVSGVIRLDAGRHSVRLRYVNEAFTGVLRVFWTSPGSSESVLDCAVLRLPPSPEDARASASPPLQ